MRSRIWGWNRGLKLQLSHFLAYRTLSKLSSWSHLSLFSFTYKMGVRLFYLLWVILQIILEHLGKASGNALKKKKSFLGFPWKLSGKESTCQCERHRFDPWSGKIPHAEEQISPCAATPKPVFESLCSTMREATSEKPTQCRPRSPQPEKSPRSNEGPAQPRIIHE